MDGEHSCFTSFNGMGVFISLANMVFFGADAMQLFFWRSHLGTRRRYGLANPGFFIEKSEAQAKKEKVELSQCNHQAVLVKCAVGAGWNIQFRKERKLTSPTSSHVAHSFVLNAIICLCFMERVT